MVKVNISSIEKYSGFFTVQLYVYIVQKRVSQGEIGIVFRNVIYE